MNNDKIYTILREEEKKLKEILKDKKMIMDELESCLKLYKKLRESAIYIFCASFEEEKKEVGRKIDIGDGIYIYSERRTNKKSFMEFDITWGVRHGEYIIDDPYKIEEQKTIYALIPLISILKIFYIPIKLQMKKYIIKKINELWYYIEAEKIIREGENS